MASWSALSEAGRVYPMKSNAATDPKNSVMVIATGGSGKTRAAFRRWARMNVA